MTDENPGPVGPRGATLAKLTEQLGGGILEILAAPRGVEVEVLHAVIYDPVEPPGIDVDDLVLAVGVRVDSEAARTLVRHAGAAHATGVVFKLTGAVPDDLLNAATEHSVAVAGVPAELTWSQLHGLLRTALASTGHAADAAPGGVPLGDLFALANAVAAMVGGPVTIEDPRSRVLAYSNFDGDLEAGLDEARRQTILGRRVPDRWLKMLHDSGLFRRLWTSGDVVHVDDLVGDGSVRPRLAIAVRAGDDILGSIWVAEGDRPFDARAPKTPSAKRRRWRRCTWCAPARATTWNAACAPSSCAPCSTGAAPPRCWPRAWVSTSTGSWR